MWSSLCGLSISQISRHSCGCFAVQVCGLTIQTSGCSCPGSHSVVCACETPHEGVGGVHRSCMFVERSQAILVVAVGSTPRQSGCCAEK